ncbi:MAG: hypothetical protein COB36_12050 [Alphaproteobacteria bacterium]|nr:MAG: hypothetical protein COB36_12050 [Alphaproteobacteria bacterium]
MSDTDRFKTTNCNDPRGKHWSLWDSLRCKTVCARAWKEEDIIKLAEMHNNGSIEPNYENRYINHDVEIHLKDNK